MTCKARRIPHATTFWEIRATRDHGLSLGTSQGYFSYRKRYSSAVIESQPSPVHALPFSKFNEPAHRANQHRDRKH